MSEQTSLALSVRQPWAWAIVHAGKDVENRSRIAMTKGNMNAHARIAIHASRGMTRDEYESAAEFMEGIDIIAPRPDQLIRGGIIGTVQVVDIVKDHESPWFFGPWALVLDDAQPCEPIPCSGQLGFFKWKQSGELIEPLPWMRRWPNTLRPTRNGSRDEPYFFGQTEQ